MLPQEVIAKKRDGLALTKTEIGEFVSGVVSGEFHDYQASALLMALFLRGMSIEETSWLTEFMMRSGRVVELPEIERPKVDKHSTGGVGDKISLILAPLAAACGLCVPMMSGRGLGHTGGTLDKLESIPGFSVDLDDSSYRRQLREINVAMIGQSADIVPADRKLYALRDVTATVESIPLICASILSKKLAEGIDSLVLDVKCGKGAFMESEAEARCLAEALVAISRGVGKPTTAVITRMEQPLGCAVGNSLEVMESIECLKGQGPEDLMEVTFALTGEMLLLGGICRDLDEAQILMTEKLHDGTALKVFCDLVAAQGGDVSCISDPQSFSSAGVRTKLCCEKTFPSYISAINARLVGEAARLLGAGRAHADSEIDPAVGIVLQKKSGDRVAPGEPIFEIHGNSLKNYEEALARLRDSVEYSAEKPKRYDLIIDRIGN